MTLLIHAISTTLLSVLSAGDHVLVQEGVYGGTQGLLTKDLPPMVIGHTFVAGDDPAAWRATLTRPVQVSHVGMPAEERARLGISDGLARMSVGIEDVADLIADLDQALEASQK